MASSLDILLLSDTMANWHFIDKLVEAESDLEKNSYDYILLAGGQVNV